MLEIDGSYGSGGGQILRTALALSAILGRGFSIRNIRARRPRPGLMPQHLASVRAAAGLCNARVRGGVLGSTELDFEPGPIKAGNLVVDVAGETGSAGAVTLVAQTVMPIMFFASQPCTATLRGGTHVPFSPVYEYLAQVVIPFIRNLGYRAEARLCRAGFYPAGGGEVLLRTMPAQPPGTDRIVLAEPGRRKGIRIVSAVSRLPVSIAERQLKRLGMRLKNTAFEAEVREVPADGPGTYLYLEAEYERITVGFSALGRKGKPAEAVADEVYEQFAAHEQTGCALDPHLADQCLIFLLLRNVPFTFTTSRVTGHLETNIWLLNRFLPDREIELQVNQDRTGVVRTGCCK
ncbi:MAG: RNA 3'-terminal phosphate cyclase [candidate division WOR-3 bacterium]|uniref:RNA 3'-terminal phosphate cyclase n=1 Tax=candidate division WOR-3 bacterium TaxID=2052148 RepID=A0A7C1SGY2_UNCW3|nr:RNA 3'-terminal phosphate cyclase [candidate division WOR-3 bacterium]